MTFRSSSIPDPKNGVLKVKTKPAFLDSRKAGFERVKLEAWRG